MYGIKNIEKAQVLTLKSEVAYQPGQVVSKTLAQNNALSVTLFAFDKGEEISTHESGGDAFVTCLDGVGRITIDGKDYELHEGESIVMPARHPHAVFGQEQFKMLLAKCHMKTPEIVSDLLGTCQIVQTQKRGCNPSLGCSLLLCLFGKAGRGSLARLAERPAFKKQLRCLSPGEIFSRRCDGDDNPGLIKS